MASLYVGVAGESIYIDLGEDISSYTAEIILQAPCSSPVTKTAVVGVANIDTEIGLLLANQYVYYTFVADDLDQSGTWQSRAVLTNSPAVKKSNWIPFQVGE